MLQDIFYLWESGCRNFDIMIFIANISLLVQITLDALECYIGAGYDV